MIFNIDRINDFIPSKEKNPFSQIQTECLAEFLNLKGKHVIFSDDLFFDYLQNEKRFNILNFNCISLNFNHFSATEFFNFTEKVLQNLILFSKNESMWIGRSLSLVQSFSPVFLKYLNEEKLSFDITTIFDLLNDISFIYFLTKKFKNDPASDKLNQYLIRIPGYDQNSDKNGSFNLKTKENHWFTSKAIKYYLLNNEDNSHQKNNISKILQENDSLLFFVDQSNKSKHLSILQYLSTQHENLNLAFFNTPITHQIIDEISEKNNTLIFMTNSFKKSISSHLNEFDILIADFQKDKINSIISSSAKTSIIKKL